MVPAKAALHVELHIFHVELYRRGTGHGSLTDHRSFQAKLPTNFYLSWRKACRKY